MTTIQPLVNGKYYHIHNRGINSDILFKENSNYEYFLKLYDQHIDPIAETYAWCLMKNRFDFLVRIKGTDELNMENKVRPSQSFSNLFNAYTKAFNKNYNRHGALFERPFNRKEINDNTYLQNVILYIHNNPVNHFICEHPLLYPWSSYITCVSNEPTKLKRKEIIENFSNLENLKYIHELNDIDFSIEYF